jgi:hypothetical protein
MRNVGEARRNIMLYRLLYAFGFFSFDDLPSWEKRKVCPCWRTCDEELTQLRKLTQQRPDEAVIEQLTSVEARLDAVDRALAEQRSVSDERERLHATKLDRSLGAIEAQLDAATAHFSARTQDVSAEAKRARASADEVRRAIVAMRDLVEQMSRFCQSVEESLPQKAEHALRTLIHQIEQEPGVLAIALKNVSSFTETISKTLERDQ